MVSFGKWGCVALKVFEMLPRLTFLWHNLHSANVLNISLVFKYLQTNEENEDIFKNLNVI